MENTVNNAAGNAEAIEGLLNQAKNNLIADMAGRGLAAIIWDNATAGFHYLPVATLGEGKVVNISGLYAYDGELYLIEEDCAKANIDRYYDQDSQVRPTVVTLTPSVAAGDLGTPTPEDGFTQTATLEEWLGIADCYFEALAEA